MCFKEYIFDYSLYVDLIFFLYCKTQHTVSNVVYHCFTPFLEENSVCILRKGTEIFYFKTQNSLSLLLSVSSFLYLAELEYLAIIKFFSSGKALFSV